MNNETDTGIIINAVYLHNMGR